MIFIDETLKKLKNTVLKDGATYYFENNINTIIFNPTFINIFSKNYEDIKSIMPSSVKEEWSYLCTMYDNFHIEKPVFIREKDNCIEIRLTNLEDICYEKKGVTIRIDYNFYSDDFEIIRNGKYTNIVTNEKLKISYNRITEEIKFCNFDEDENIELMNMFLLNETDAKVMLVKTDGGIIPYTY